jgi:hypothetical protein
MKRIFIVLLVLFALALPAPARASFQSLVFDDYTQTTWVFVDCHGLSLSGWYDPSGVLTLVCLSGSIGEIYTPDHIVFVPTDY